MNCFLKHLGVGMMGILFATCAIADSFNSFPGGVQLGVGISATSGLNGFVGYANKNFDSFWWKRLGFRFDFASTKPIRSNINSLIEKYVGDEKIEIGDDLEIATPTLKAKHVAAMIDIYPFGNTWFLGGWRLTGGYYMGNTSISAAISGTESSNGEFELGDERFKYTDGVIHAKAKANWKYSGPYAGTGFDLGLFYGIKIFFDAGVVFTSKSAALDLDIPTDNLQQWDGSDWGTLNPSDLETAKRKELDEAQKEMDKIKFYPIVKIGFMYRF
ncbi:MAG: hypothetical protein J5742_00645 [Alphaproteobacteria bacterium]|nr:hypothetical protein [Alphaproteobacteria bacterium]